MYINIYTYTSGMHYTYVLNVYIEGGMYLYHVQIYIGAQI